MYLLDEVRSNRDVVVLRADLVAFLLENVGDLLRNRGHRPATAQKEVVFVTPAARHCGFPRGVGVIVMREGALRQGQSRHGWSGTVMDNFLQARRSPPPPALRERRHRGPARRRVTMRQRAIFVLPESEVDRHGLPTGAAAVLHDARATTAVGASYSGVNRSSTCKLHQTK